MEVLGSAIIDIEKWDAQIQEGYFLRNDQTACNVPSPMSLLLYILSETLSFIATLFLAIHKF